MVRIKILLKCIAISLVVQFPAARAGVIDKNAAKLFQNRQHVRVCFANYQGWSRAYLNMVNGANSSEFFKSSVSESITSTFRYLETGIEYVFVGDCGNNPDDADAVVVFTYSSYGEAFLSAKTFPKGFSKPYIAMGAYHGEARADYHFTAIHEFGHMSGIAHEHMRKEVFTDRRCDSLNKLVKRGVYILAESTTLPNDDYDLVGNYDPDSIMNYCKHPTSRDYGNAVLSSGDREALLQIIR